jgi:hypothetical protein
MNTVIHAFHGRDLINRNDLLEFLGDRASSTQIQIFGTDISEPTIEKARAGTDSEASLRDVRSPRLRRFFAKTDSGYRINKIIGEMCVFARQDLTKDPPFSRLDLISCRNVLIYLGAAAQRRIVSGFHYALADTGFLLLGKSESLTAYSDLFMAADKKVRVFVKKPNSGMAAPDFSFARLETAALELHDDLNQRLAALSLQAEAIAQRTPAAAAGMGKQAQELCASLSELSDAVRRIAHDLHPSILGHFGLVAALRSYCSRGAGDMHRSLRDIFQLPRASPRSKKRHAGRLRVNHCHAGIGNEVTCIFVGCWIKSKDGVFRQQ